MKLVQTLALASLLLAGVPAIADEEMSVNPTPTTIAQAPINAVKLAPITDDQRSKLRALRDQYKLNTAEKKALLEVTQGQLRETLGAVSVDKGAALALQAKINGLRAELSTARLNMMLAASDVFTPEQRAAFKSMRGRHGHHGGGFRHGGHGGGFGGHGGPGGRGQCGPGQCGPGGPKGAQADGAKSTAS
jgi:Spy/CpxP family protein refolding chaperone